MHWGLILTLKHCKNHKILKKIVLKLLKIEIGGKILYFHDNYIKFSQIQD